MFRKTTLFLFNNSILWLLGFCLLGPIIAAVGLYDQAGFWWHRTLYFLPVLPAAVLVIYRSVLIEYLRYDFPDNWKRSIFHLLLFAAAATGLIWWLGAGQNKVMAYCNVYEKEVGVAFYYRSNRLAEKTEGYIYLPPDKCIEIERNFLRVPFTYQISASTKEDIDKLFAGKEKKLNLDRSDILSVVDGGDIPAQLTSTALSQKFRGKEIAWEKGNYHNVARALNTEPDLEANELRSAPFITVAASSTEEKKHTAWITGSGVDRSLEVCNLQPLEARIDLYYRTKKAEWKIDGGKELSPGSCRVFSRNFQRINPNFAIRSSLRGDVVKWYMGQSSIEFEGTKNRSACVSQQDEAVFNKEPAKGKCSAGEKRKYFEDLTDPETRAPVASINLTFDEKEIPLPMKNGEIDVEMAKRKIAVLGGWWKKRKSHLDEFENAPLPFETFATVGENDSHNVQGVVVLDVDEDSPLGNSLGFTRGEIILTVDGKPIFSPVDFDIAVIEHGYSLSGGVLKPLKYTVLQGTGRKGKIIEKESAILFNPAYWSTRAGSDWDWVYAGMWGLADGLTFGNAVRIWCAGKTGNDQEICTWETKEHVARLMQMHPDWFSAGNFMGGVLTFVPMIRAARVIATVLGGSLAAELVANAAVSVAAEALTIYEEALPGENIGQKLRNSILPAAVSGAAFHLVFRK